MATVLRYDPDSVFVATVASGVSAPAVGTLVAVNTTSTVAIATAASGASTRVPAIGVAIADATKPGGGANYPVTLATRCLVAGYDSLVTGMPVYVTSATGSTAGLPTSTAPTSSGLSIQGVGVALSSDVVNFDINPNFKTNA